MDEHKTTIRIPEELHRRVKAKAALQGKTITSVLTELLQQWVEEDPPAPEKRDK
ncbi:MAG: toxin-antitoxin system HicB family antitoxin [Anaerolineae bacterium]|nr:toxin-antitoxin system HicB family antitoxin [Anaerolineae bacterium]